jgi:hypothetical protein
VVATHRGLYWSGAGWVTRWQDAEQFAFPLPDPWLACWRVCEAVAAREGVYTVPCHISRKKVRTPPTGDVDPGVRFPALAKALLRLAAEDLAREQAPPPADPPPPPPRPTRKARRLHARRREAEPPPDAPTA